VFRGGNQDVARESPGHLRARANKAAGPLAPAREAVPIWESGCARPCGRPSDAGLEVGRAHLALGRQATSSGARHTAAPCSHASDAGWCTSLRPQSVLGSRLLAQIREAIRAIFSLCHTTGSEEAMPLESRTAPPLQEYPSQLATSEALLRRWVGACDQAPPPRRVCISIANSLGLARLESSTTRSTATQGRSRQRGISTYARPLLLTKSREPEGPSPKPISGRS
jgi:hypothetical protein